VGQGKGSWGKYGSFSLELIGSIEGIQFRVREGTPQKFIDCLGS